MLLETSKRLIYWTLVSGQPLRVRAKDGCQQHLSILVIFLLIAHGSTLQPRPLEKVAPANPSLRSQGTHRPAQDGKTRKIMWFDRIHESNDIWGCTKRRRLRSRDYSRPLASEPDVKVSLHPAQASRRPCEGPASSHITCWLYDTGRKSMPISAPWGIHGQLARSLSNRGREHQWSKATDICNTFSTDSSDVLVPRHRREVSSLARRVMLQPVSTPLQGGIRFFPPPYPHAFGWPYGLPPFTSRSDTGLPRSTRLTRMGEVLSVRR
jgi:hypothetical protein